MVERLKGGRWQAFSERRGEWGRDLALWAARRYSGLMLAELGRQAGGLDYTAVAMAVKRFDLRAARDKDLNARRQEIVRQCEM